MITSSSSRSSRHPTDESLTGKLEGRYGSSARSVPSHATQLSHSRTSNDPPFWSEPRLLPCDDGYGMENDEEDTDEDLLARSRSQSPPSDSTATSDSSSSNDGISFDNDDDDEGLSIEPVTEFTPAYYFKLDVLDEWIDRRARAPRSTLIAEDELSIRQFARAFIVAEEPHEVTALRLAKTATSRTVVVPNRSGASVLQVCNDRSWRAAETRLVEALETYAATLAAGESCDRRHHHRTDRSERTSDEPLPGRRGRRRRQRQREFQPEFDLNFVDLASVRRPELRRRRSHQRPCVLSSSSSSSSSCLFYRSNESPSGPPSPCPPPPPPPPFPTLSSYEYLSSSSSHGSSRLHNVVVVREAFRVAFGTSDPAAAQLSDGSFFFSSSTSTTRMIESDRDRGGGSKPVPSFIVLEQVEEHEMQNDDDDDDDELDSSSNSDGNLNEDQEMDYYLRREEEEEEEEEEDEKKWDDFGIEDDKAFFARLPKF